jgi:two-component sensor histidine kinase
MYVNIVEKKKLKELVDEKTANLRSALVEKDVLIKEIHHRVKNNMAVVSGLLELQSWKMEDGDAKEALENSKLRIQTMSSIHEKLYQNENLSSINFKLFAEDLVWKVANSLKGKNKAIKVEIDIEERFLSVNEAIPFGLILNEALCNCYEHAFKDLNRGKVSITFKSLNESEYILKVKDNGVGVPENIMSMNHTSLGLTLINSLVTQINGTLEFLKENGTTIKIVTPK